MEKHADTSVDHWKEVQKIANKYKEEWMPDGEWKHANKYLMLYYNIMESFIKKFLGKYKYFEMSEVYDIRNDVCLKLLTRWMKRAPYEHGCQEIKLMCLSCSYTYFKKEKKMKILSDKLLQEAIREI